MRDTQRRLQESIMVLIMVGLQSSVRDNAKVDLDYLVEKRLPRMGIYENLTLDDLWQLVSDASSQIQSMEESGTHHVMLDVVNLIKEFGYEKTALALVADTMLIDEELGDLEGKVYGGFAGHLGVDHNLQLSILLGVRAFSRTW